MSTISSALDDEREYEDTKKEKHDAMIRRSQDAAAGNSVESISGGKGFRYEADPVKGKL